MVSTNDFISICVRVCIWDLVLECEVRYITIFSSIQIVTFGFVSNFLQPSSTFYSWWSSRPYTSDSSRCSGNIETTEQEKACYCRIIFYRFVKFNNVLAIGDRHIIWLKIETYSRRHYSCIKATFLFYFLEVLKCTLQNFQKILEKSFPVIYSNS